jgi:hypothetical protein
MKLEVCAVRNGSSTTRIVKLGALFGGETSP